MTATPNGARYFLRENNTPLLLLRVMNTLSLSFSARGLFLLLASVDRPLTLAEIKNAGPNPEEGFAALMELLNEGLLQRHE